MSIKIAVGSKIYDISTFSEEQKDDVLDLAKQLNFRVNQVISAFSIYEQEEALVLAALSILEELKEEQQKPEKQEEIDLFNYKEEKEKMYSREEVEQIVLNTVNSLHEKLKNIL